MSYGGFTLPKGFRFHPSDEELLSHYLQKKNQRTDSQITDIIPEIDVSKYEPRDLPALVLTKGEFLDREWFTMANSPDMEWYFFSPRVFKHSKSKSESKSTKINRTTEEGSWKKQGNDRRITEACSDKQIGGKRILTFYLPEKQKTDWVIHEYYLTKANCNEQIGDYVLCRLKDNRLKKKSGKSDQDRQDAPLCDGGAPSSGSCIMTSNVEDQASIELGNDVVIPNGKDVEAEHGGGSCSMALNVESPASKQLEDVLPIPYGNDHDAEHGGGSSHIVSGVLTEAEEYQGFEALRDALSESHGSEQTGPFYIDEMVEELLHKPGDLALPHPPLSPQLQSPIYPKLGTNNNDEYRKRKFPFGDSDPFLTKKNHTDEAENAIPEGYSQPGGNLGSDSFINREPRDLPHDNNFIKWDDLPTIIEGFESSLADFSVIDGGITDRNIESAYGSVGEDAEALYYGPKETASPESRQ